MLIYVLTDFHIIEIQVYIKNFLNGSGVQCIWEGEKSESKIYFSRDFWGVHVDIYNFIYV